MSRSVHDLLDAIRHDEDHRFDVDGVVQGALRRSHRRTVRRRTAAAIVVAGLAVLAVAVPSVALRTAGGQSEPGSSPTAPRPALSSTLQSATVGDWTVSLASTGPDLQIGYIRRVGQLRTSGAVEVYEPGAFDPAPVQGLPTTVDGAPAYYSVVFNPFNVVPDPSLAAVPTLAWRHATNGWVVVRGDFDHGQAPTDRVPDGLRQAASAVRLGPPVPVRLPFRVGYRPPGLRPVHVFSYDAADVRRVVEYERVGGPHTWPDPRAHENASLRIAMTPAIPAQWLPDTTVGGQPAMRNGDREVVVARGDQWVSIGSGINVAVLSTAEVEWIYAGLTFADWADQSTWFEANTAA